jgi:hypothetical protein
MNTETFASHASQPLPLWKSQLARWLQKPAAGSADPPRHAAPDAAQTGDASARSAPTPAWPRVFPGL